MQLSIIILTHNRCEVLLQTLQRLTALASTSEVRFEIIVVDSASEDKTIPKVTQAFPDIHLISLETNLASPGRNQGADQAQAPVLLFLDDDSYPLPGTIEKALTRFEHSPQLLALGGQVDMPGGKQDAAAYPLVFPACALFVRTDAFLKTGGFPDDFKWQAEEYALAFKLLGLGGQLVRDTELKFFHEKTSVARQSHKTLRNDLTNNLILCSRFLPSHWRHRFRKDWIERYLLFAQSQGLDLDLIEVLQEAREKNKYYRLEQLAHSEKAHPWRLSEQAFEKFFALESMTQSMEAWKAKHHPGDVIISGYSKNLLMVHEACRRNDLKIIGIADDNPALKQQRYHGTPIRTLSESVFMNPDGVLLAEINPARVETAEANMNKIFKGPILKLLDSHEQ